MTTDAMTRTFGVALSAIRPGPPYGAWRTIGRQPIGRLQVERMMQGFPSPGLVWEATPEPIVVQGAVLLDPAGEQIQQFQFHRDMPVYPHDYLRWTFP